MTKRICVVLGCGRAAALKQYNKDGSAIWRNFCDKHHRMRPNIKLSKKDYCENREGYLGFLCTATIIDSCQLQIDHDDGDRTNNSDENLKTICGNCHAVKTKRQKDHTNRYRANAAPGMFSILFTEDQL